jgi:hypothetical protein
MEINFLYIYLPKGKFHDDIMRTRPRGSATISALESNAICGSLACYVKHIILKLSYGILQFHVKNNVIIKLIFFSIN